LNRGGNVETVYIHYTTTMHSTPDLTELLEAFENLTVSEKEEQVLLLQMLRAATTHILCPDRMVYTTKEVNGSLSLQCMCTDEVTCKVYNNTATGWLFCCMGATTAVLLFLVMYEFTRIGYGEKLKSKSRSAGIVKL
jgi:hypothetical protein